MTTVCHREERRHWLPPAPSGPGDSELRLGQPSVLRESEPSLLRAQLKRHHAELVEVLFFVDLHEPKRLPVAAELPVKLAPPPSRHRLGQVQPVAEPRIHTT